VAYDDERTLISWMREMEIDDSMLYKQAGIRQMCFFRDLLSTVFLHKDTHHRAANDFVHIHGFHKSKSVQLPVYHIAIPGLDIWARDNFYNWNITVQSVEQEIDIPNYFHIDGGKDYLFMEGMDGLHRSLYAQNRKSFSFCLFHPRGDYELYAVMMVIASHFEKYLPLHHEEKPSGESPKQEA
jgi:hypothetical protein